VFNILYYVISEFSIVALVKPLIGLAYFFSDRFLLYYMAGQRGWQVRQPPWASYFLGLKFILLIELIISTILLMLIILGHMV
jgi:hypothetical protein